MSVYIYIYIYIACALLYINIYFIFMGKGSTFLENIFCLILGWIEHEEKFNILRKGILFRLCPDMGERKRENERFLERIRGHMEEVQVFFLEVGSVIGEMRMGIFDKSITVSKNNF